MGTDVEEYLVNRSAPGEYRVAKRAVSFDVFKTFTKTNTTRRGMEKRNERFVDMGVLAKSKNRFKGSQKKRNRTNGRRNFAGWRQARIAESGGFNLAGDYEQRRTGLAPEGEISCFEFGDTCRFKKVRPFVLAIQKTFMRDPQEGKKGGMAIQKEEEVRKEGNVKEKVEKRGRMCDLLKLKIARLGIRRFLRNKRRLFLKKIMLILPIGKF